MPGTLVDKKKKKKEIKANGSLKEAQCLQSGYGLADWYLFIPLHTLDIALYMSYYHTAT